MTAEPQAPFGLLVEAAAAGQELARIAALHGRLALRLAELERENEELAAQLALTQDKLKAARYELQRWRRPGYQPKRRT